MKEFNIDIWSSMAKVALEIGYTEDEIANSVRGHIWSWTGNISGMWDNWLQFFKQLIQNKDDQIQKIGAIGKRNIEIELNKALKEESQKAIYGR